MVWLANGLRGFQCRLTPPRRVANVCVHHPQHNLNATGTSELMSARRNEAQTRLTRLVDNLRQTEEELRAKNYQLTSATDEVRPCRPLTRVCSEEAFTVRVRVCTRLPST